MHTQMLDPKPWEYYLCLSLQYDCLREENEQKFVTPSSREIFVFIVHIPQFDEGIV
jgi:hypothetical protein